MTIRPPFGESAVFSVTFYPSTLFGMKALSVLLFLFLFLSLHQNSFAQRQLEVGISSGATFYHGDLGNEQGVQWGGVNPGMAITFRNFFNNKRGYATRSLTMETRLSWHRLGYDETKSVGGIVGQYLRNYGRGINFRTDLIGASAHLVLNAFENPFKPMAQQSIYGFFFVGVGVFYGQPKADLFYGAQSMDNRYYHWDDGSIRDQPESSGAGTVIGRDGDFETNLRDWNTEGQGISGENDKVQKPYSAWNIGIPMGFGIRVALSKRIKLSAEYSYYAFFTDYLDDVSENYATRDQIAASHPNDLQAQQMAAYISDPTNKGTNGEPGPPYTSPRGNPDMKDSFSYISVELSYSFKRKPKRRTFVSL